MSTKGRVDFFDAFPMIGHRLDLKGLVVVLREINVDRIKTNGHGDDDDDDCE